MRQNTRLGVEMMNDGKAGKTSAETRLYGFPCYSHGMRAVGDKGQLLHPPLRNTPVSSSALSTVTCAAVLSREKKAHQI